MKYFSWFLIIAITLVSCKGRTGYRSDDTAAEKPLGNMSLNDNRINVNVKINDTISMNALFDTGAVVGLVLHDTTVVKYDLGKPIEDFGPTFKIRGQKITVDSAEINYPSAYVNRVADYYLTPQLFAPLYREDKRIWYLDFDNGKLEVTDAFVRSEDALVFPLERDKYKAAIWVTLPLTFISGTDTLQTKYRYFIDTGTPHLIYFTDPPQEIWDFSEKMPHVGRLEYLPDGSRGRRFRDFDMPRTEITRTGIEVGAARCLIDQGQRSFRKEYGWETPGTLGVRFFKHFNTAFDLGNDLLILEPRKSIEPDTVRRNGLGFNFNSEGLVIWVDMPGEAQKAGILPGDIVQRINGRKWDELTEYQKNVLKDIPDDSEIDIIVGRNGESRHIHYVIKRILL